MGPQGSWPTCHHCCREKGQPDLSRSPPFSLLRSQERLSRLHEAQFGLHTEGLAVRATVADWEWGTEDLGTTPPTRVNASVGHLFSISGLPFPYLGIEIIYLALFLGWPQRSEMRVFGAYSGRAHGKSRVRGWGAAWRIRTLAVQDQQSASGSPTPR